MFRLFQDRYFKMQLLLTGAIVLVAYFLYIFGFRTFIFMDIGADIYSYCWPMHSYMHSWFTDGFDGFWSFQVGLGANIFAYSKDMFNPISLYIALFPPEQMHIGYISATIILLFATSFLSNGYLKKVGLSPFASMIGSLIITFSGYSICWGHHYAFGVMFVMFLFILYAFERWLIEKKWLMLILSTALMAATEVYFFYMTAIFMIFYALFRFLWLHDFRLKGFFSFFLKTLLLALIGVGLSLILLLPQAYTILASPRVGSSVLPSLDLASPTHYLSILYRLFSNTLLGINDFQGVFNFYESPFLYCSILLLFILPSYFVRPLRTPRRILVISIIIAGIVTAPFLLNPIFNFFSADRYRWTFLLVPPAAIAVGYAVDQWFTNKKYFSTKIFIIPLLFIIGTMILYYMIILPEFNDTEYWIPLTSSIVVIMTSVFYFLFFWNNRKQSFSEKLHSGKRILTFILAAELCCMSLLAISPRNTIRQENIVSTPYFDGTRAIVEQLRSTDPDFFRIDKTYSQIDLNDAWIQSFYGEKMYNTCISTPVNDIMETYGLRINRRNTPYFYGLADRQLLRNLLSGKYRISQEPLQFTDYNLLFSHDELYVYQNKNSVPILFAYDTQIPSDIFNDLNDFEKQYALYFGVVSNQDLGLSDVNMDTMSSYKTSSISCSFEADSLQNISVQDDYIVWDNDMGSTPELTYILKDTPSSPILVNFTLDFVLGSSSSEEFSEKKLVLPDSTLYYYETDDQDRTVDRSVTFALTPGKHSYQLYIDSANMAGLSLAFSNLPLDASFEISGFEVKSLSFPLEKLASQLRQDCARIDLFTDNYVKATYKNDGDSKILFFQTAYDAGWSAKINGQNVPVYNINHGFCGVPVPEGYSEIELVYTPPFLIEGAFISAATLFGIVIVLIFTKRQNRNKKTS